MLSGVARADRIAVEPGPHGPLTWILFLRWNIGSPEQVKVSAIGKVSALKRRAGLRPPREPVITLCHLRRSWARLLGSEPSMGAVARLRIFPAKTGTMQKPATANQTRCGRDVLIYVASGIYLPMAP
jgi:hypothetical protein